MSEFSHNEDIVPTTKENETDLPPIKRGGNWTRRVLVGAAAGAVLSTTWGIVQEKSSSEIHENDTVTHSMVRAALPLLEQHVAPGLKITEEDVPDAKRFNDTWGDLTITNPGIDPAKVVIKYDEKGQPQIEEGPGTDFSGGPEEKLKEEGAPTALLKDLDQF
jgi:hypothetical protein